MKSIQKRKKKKRINRQDEPEQCLQLVLDREELVAMMQGCLTEFAIEVGLKVACLLLEEEAEVLGGRAPARSVAKNSRIKEICT
jgi:hypothetical protein